MIASVIAILVLLTVIYLLGRPIVHGAIFFPTSTRNVNDMIDMASLRKGDKIVDLGSGDGRIVVACAERGIRAEGYEINPILVFTSRRRVRCAGLKGLAAIHWRSFWHVDLAPFDAVFVYGIPYIMNDLQKKLERELRPGAKVVSNVFRFPGWMPKMEKKEEKVFLYER